MTIRASLPFLVLLATAAGQNTWIVDAGGGGNFLDIPPALAAAQPGDTPIVRAGSYSAALVNEGIRIVGESGAVVGAGGTTPAITVDRLPAGETCVVRGLSLSPFSAGIQVQVQDCLGHVHLEGMRLTYAMRVERSRQVSVYGIVAYGAPALRIADSTALVVGCSLTGALSVSAPSHAVVVDRSTLTFAHGVARGGLNYTGVGAGSGIDLQSGRLILSGGAETIIAAGDSLVGANPPAPAIVTASGTIIRDPQVQLIPRWGGLPISGGASVTTRPIASVLPNIAGQVLTVTTRSVPGHTIYLLGGLALQPVLSLPLGELWIGTIHVVLDSVLVPGTGTHTTTVNLPPLPPATLLTLQALDVAGTSLELSTPAVATIDR